MGSYWPPLCGRGLSWAIRPIGPTYIAYDGPCIYTVYDGGISVAYVYIFHIDIGKLSCAIDAIPKDAAMRSVALLRHRQG